MAACTSSWWVELKSALSQTLDDSNKTPTSFKCSACGQLTFIDFDCFDWRCESAGCGHINPKSRASCLVCDAKGSPDTNRMLQCSHCGETVTVFASRGAQLIKSACDSTIKHCSIEAKNFSQMGKAYLDTFGLLAQEIATCLTADDDNYWANNARRVSAYRQRGRNPVIGSRRSTDDDMYWGKHSSRVSSSRQQPSVRRAPVPLSRGRTVEQMPHTCSGDGPCARHAAPALAQSSPALVYSAVPSTTTHASFMQASHEPVFAQHQPFYFSADMPIR